MAKLTKKIIEDQTSNSAKSIFDSSLPYIVEVSIQGNSDILFHRWNCESVEAKSNSAKGSKAKKSDDIETFVYRNDNNEICIPGEYLRQAIIHAAKFRQDPRSARKSAMDLFKAGIISLTQLAPLGTTEWDYEDKRRVVIQRSAISRIRPAMRPGWKATFQIMVNVPEYISPDFLNEMIQMAGRLIGIADFRPSYGRFNVIKFEVLNS